MEHQSGKYVGEFQSREQVRENFSVDKKDFPREYQILYASYDWPSYEGDAFVLFERDGKLYEVNGSHCSCYGLEGQWEPEETTWAALAIRSFTTHGSPYLTRLIKRRIKKAQAV